MPVLTAAERLGTTLAGKYRLDRILGKGGMGTVFAGVHTWTGRQVAVKMLNAESAIDEIVVERFLQEAKAAARLEHPNVVDVLDMGHSEDGAVYLVLELLQGEPLTAIVARGSMSVAGTLARLLPVLDALAAAHAHGIIHRDLKPDNIFLSLTPQGRVVPKLLDFGIAKVAGGRVAKTTAGFIVGTPEYMSPEQAQGKIDLGPASDVWSMGVVLFECLTGRLPFKAESSTGLLVAIVTQRAPGVRTFNPDIARPIAKVVDRALQRKPEARFANAGELGKALHDAARSVGLSDLGGAALLPFAPGTSGVEDLGPAKDTDEEQTAVAPPPTSFTWGKGSASTAERLPKRRVVQALVGAGVFLALATAVGVAVFGGEPPPVAAPAALVTAPPPVVPEPIVAVSPPDAGPIPQAAARPTEHPNLRRRGVQRPGTGRVRTGPRRGAERGANGAPILD